MHFLSLFILYALFTVCLARDVIRLEAVNFELALTSYPYVAILFYDNSESSKELIENWESAAQLLGTSNFDGELAKVSFSSKT